MRALISEDAIEQAILSRLKDAPFNYDILICDPSRDKLNDPDDGTFRLSKKECVLPKVLHDSLWRINAGRIDEKVIAEKVRELRKDFTGTDMVDTNYNLYKKLRDGIKVEFVKDGKNTFDFLRLIDFDNPENNTFTASVWWKENFDLMEEGMIKGLMKNELFRQRFAESFQEIATDNFDYEHVHKELMQWQEQYQTQTVKSHQRFISADIDAEDYDAYISYIDNFFKMRYEFAMDYLSEEMQESE